MFSFLSCVQLFEIPWTVACQAPLSMGFPRQKHWSGLPWPPPGDLPNPGVKPQVSCIAGGFFTTEPPEELLIKLLLLLLSRFSRVRLCDPVDSSPPGSPVPGILRTRTLEWVAISLSNAWKRKVKVQSLSRVRLLATPWTAAYQAPLSMGFSRQEYWSGVPLIKLSFNKLKNDYSVFIFIDWYGHDCQPDPVKV